MEPITAFVSHSFSKNDAEVVRKVLEILDRISQLHRNFSWEDAKAPEPKTVDRKVLERFAGKNLLIGICTKQERAVVDSALTFPWYFPGSFFGRSVSLEWKASDWIIQ